MTDPTRPGTAQQALVGDIDDIVPSQGYRKVPLVGLGGSGGSVPALERFFKTMPMGSGLGFMVFANDGEDGPEVLQAVRSATRMKVAEAVGRLHVEPGQVLVVPPGHALHLADGDLHSTPVSGDQVRHVAVDIFFRALADCYGPHAAAVVLSGTDAGGAIGIKRIKERGGLAVSQDPEEADHGGMPRSAIATGMVDWVLPVAEMPARLLSYFRIEKSLVLPPEELPAATSPGARGEEETELRDVLNFLRTRTGRDFGQYKRATVLRRIARRMQVNGVDNLGGYLNCLRTRPGEAGALLQDLLISVTNFFRDPECFASLEQHIPSLFQGKATGDVVRVWVVACATGEEAYSIAILLSEYARTLEAPPSIQVFATDLDEEAIQAAREGVYPGAIAADVSEERLRRFFMKEHRGYRVRRELRELVLFAVHDVLKDSPFSRLDFVSCRNLLIYLTRDSQQRVLHTLHFGLLPHGKLLLGSSESIEEGSPLFSVLDKKHRIFVQRPSPRPAPRAMLLPTAPATLKLALESQHAVREAPVVVRPSFDAAPEPAPSRLREIARGVSWGDVHLQLLEQLAPPSVLIDSDYEILHLSATAGRFLQIGGGEPSRNLLRALPAPVRLELRAALYQASQKGQPAELPSMPIEAGGAVTLTTLRVVPMHEGGHPLFLVTFSAQGERVPLAEAQDARLDADPLARHLDREMERLKLHLRDTVEQYEASTEELKASNEELQAMNEELRAATEELETSREELQSINEELTTVNQELKSKVEQLSHANSDMHNLMDATAIATVFLDRELKITRYTPAAVKLFNLIPTDVGRPLTDMATQLDYAELGEDARRVLERLVPVEREVGQADGSWYLARLMPYRTLDDRIAGVVFTFIDITERKQAEEMRLWLSAVVTSTSDGIVSFALDQTILSWNSGAERIYGYTAAEAIGRPLSVLAPEGNESLQHVLSEIAAGRAVDNLETVRRRKDGSAIHVSITASPILDASGRVMAGTAIVRDITLAREQAEALRQSDERLRMVIENVREYAIFSTDLERRITSWNAGAQRILGYSGEDAIGRSADVLFVPEDRAAGVPVQEARTALEQGRASDEREHVRKDGSRFRASGVMMVMRDAAGLAVGFVKVLRDTSDRPPAPHP